MKTDRKSKGRRFIKRLKKYGFSKQKQKKQNDDFSQNTLQLVLSLRSGYSDNLSLSHQFKTTTKTFIIIIIIVKEREKKKKKKIGNRLHPDAVESL